MLLGLIRESATLLCMDYIPLKTEQFKATLVGTKFSNLVTLLHGAEMVAK